MSSSYIDQALQVYLLGKSSLTDLIGTRLYHIKAPDKAAFPHVIYFQAVPDNTPTAFTEGNAGSPLFQFTCVSNSDDTPCDAFTIAWVLIDLLRFYQGAMDGITVKNIIVRGPQEIPNDDGNIYCIVEAEVEYIEP